MIVQNLKIPLDIQAQQDDLLYFRVSSFTKTDWKDRIEIDLPGQYIPVGPTVLTEWEKEE